jgi:uncharacterized membrane protein affecting hemolysin expression/class 3 adenylate cyclase
LGYVYSLFPVLGDKLEPSIKIRKHALPNKIIQDQSQSSGPLSANLLGLQTRHKLALSFSLLFFLITTASWLLFQNELNRSLKEYSDVLGASLAQQAAISVREPVLVNDPLALNVALGQLVRDNNIVYVSVIDVDGNTLSSSGQEPSGIDNSAMYIANIQVQEAIAGSVLLALDTQAIAAFQTRMRNLFLVILSASLALVVILAIALSRHLTSPILRAINKLEDKSDETFTIDNQNKNEAAQLEQSVETMLAQFDDMEGQILETGLWQSDTQAGDDEPARLTASILIVKVVNINTAIELLHPATLANLLREYMFYLKQAAHLYGGELQRPGGESVMVCFPTSTCGDQHSINALYCAGLFQSIMGKINAQHRQKEQQILEFRMAIHSGDIFHAPQLLSPSTNGVLGKTIDIAYFLSKQGKPNELVISESACSQAKEFESVETAGQHEISMPADNVSFMAYILGNGFAEKMSKVRLQCSHILGEKLHLRTVENTNNSA